MTLQSAALYARLARGFSMQAVVAFLCVFLRVVVGARLSLNTPLKSNIQCAQVTARRFSRNGEGAVHCRLKLEVTGLGTQQLRIARARITPLLRLFDRRCRKRYYRSAGWSSLVARWAHNPKVGGSNPPPATNKFSHHRLPFSQEITLKATQQVPVAGGHVKPIRACLGRTHPNFLDVLGKFRARCWNIGSE